MGALCHSVPDSGGRAGYDGYKRKRCSKARVAVDTLGHLLMVAITPTNEQEQAQVVELCQQVQEIDSAARAVRLCRSELRWPGCSRARAGSRHQLSGGPTGRSQEGFVLSPRRRVVERTFAWLGRCRRLARNYERLKSSSGPVAASWPQPPSCSPASSPFSKVHNRLWWASCATEQVGTSLRFVRK
jgi:transposase